MDKIKIYKYDIVLTAPIGDRKGTLTAEIINSKLEGNLFIMKHDNYFCGTIDNYGRCSISGSIKTLPKIVSYDGSGFMDGENLTLTLNIGSRKLIMTGTHASERGENP